MDRMTHAHHTAGLAAAVARASVQAEQVLAHLLAHVLGLGYGWQLVAIPCSANDFVMTGNAITGAAFNSSTKRSPRRLGQRST